MQNVGDAYIIGGADLYITSLKYVDAMIVTRVEQDVEGDVYFEVPAPVPFPHRVVQHFGVPYPYGTWCQ